MFRRFVVGGLESVMRPLVELDAVVRPLTAGGVATQGGTPAERRFTAVRRGEALRETLLDRPRVRFFRSFSLVAFPYPVRYGLRDACSLPLPYLGLTNRVFVVQVDSPVGVVTVLVSPSDPERNAETPFFKGLVAGFGPLSPAAERLVTRRGVTVLEALDACGLRPEDVDFITYDHLHTQDLRGWLGDTTASDPALRRGLLPRARLLVMEEEWRTVLGPAAPQSPWYCPGGAAGVDPSRVARLSGDVTVGDGLALVRTPGHTEGNHSIAAHTPEGLFVTSENGVCPDSYAPHASRIPGLREAARRGVDIVLNGNTLERGLEQYFSMVFERTLAGPSARDGRFPNVLPSSELTPMWFSPGLAPTLAIGDLSFGAPVRPGPEL